MKIVAIVASVVVALTIVVIGFGIWANTGDETEVLAAADKFVAPNNWTLVDEEVTPDMPVCLDGNACPSVIRNWTSKDLVTTADLNAALRNSNLAFPTAEDCTNACSAEGDVDGFRMRLTVSTPSAGNDKGKITLSVR